MLLSCSTVRAEPLGAPRCLQSSWLQRWPALAQTPENLATEIYENVLFLELGKTSELTVHTATSL